jgi:hypothetical protein
MRDPDSEAEKQRQQKVFEQAVNDHKDDKKHIVGITKDGDLLKRDRQAGPDPRSTT